MNDRALKDKELVVATDHMNRLVGEVKTLSTAVKNGRGSSVLLDKKISQLEGLQNKVQFLSAESKMYGQWGIVEEKLPVNKKNYLWLALIALSIMYLAKNS